MPGGLYPLADSQTSNESLIADEPLPAGFGELMRLPSVPLRYRTEPAFVEEENVRVNLPHTQQVIKQTSVPIPAPTQTASASTLKETTEALRIAMEAVATVLAPRALLLVALLGALGLTIPALVLPGWERLLAAVSFDMLVFWPVAYLYLKG